jgi:dTDP-4-dehydrorhamnose reductase
MKNLILGYGLLGKELVKQTGWDYLTYEKDGIDACNFDTFIEPLSQAETIINCIGYTKTYDEERDNHWKVNYEFVANLVDYCSKNGKKLVHVSTDYVYAKTSTDNNEFDIPVHQETWYSYCKLLADGYVQLRSTNYLMFRCSFKPRPFPYGKAYGNILGNFDYVDVLAGQMIELINEDRQGIWNIGTRLKTITDLARETKPDIEEIFPLTGNMPDYISMCLRKFQSRK